MCKRADHDAGAARTCTGTIPMLRTLSGPRCSRIISLSVLPPVRANAAYPSSSVAVECAVSATMSGNGSARNPAARNEAMPRSRSPFDAGGSTDEYGALGKPCFGDGLNRLFGVLGWLFQAHRDLKARSRVSIVMIHLHIPLVVRTSRTSQLCFIPATDITGTWHRCTSFNLHEAATTV